MCQQKVVREVMDHPQVRCKLQLQGLHLPGRHCSGQYNVITPQVRAVHLQHDGGAIRELASARTYSRCTIERRNFGPNVQEHAREVPLGRGGPRCGREWRLYLHRDQLREKTTG